MIVVVVDPLATNVEDATVIVDCAALAASVTNFTVALSAIGLLFNVPVMVAVPVATADVKIAEYVPSPLSVTLPRLPFVAASVMVAPPVARLFPLESFTCTRIVDVLVPSAVMTFGDAEICVVVSSAGPGIKLTLALSAKSDPFSFPVMIAVPAVVDEVSVAVYVLLPLSVILPMEPNVVVNVIVAPPVVTLFPLASLSCTVMVDVLVPLAMIDEDEAVIKLVAVLAAPGTNATVSLSVIDVPLIFPVMVAVPAVVDEVSVAVYVPLPLSVILPMEPDVVVNVTVAPPVVRLFPFASLSCTVMVDVVMPSAVMEEGEAVINEVVVLAAPGAKITISLSAIDVPLIFPVIVAVPAIVDEVSVAVYVPSP